MLKREPGVRLSAAEIYRKSSPRIAYIEAIGSTEGATGSGFLVTETGEILTNAHVVEGADQVRVSLGGGRLEEAEITGSDPSTDLALLRVAAFAGRDPLPLGNADQLVVGDQVAAIGNPFGLDRTLTTGVISALQRRIISPDGTTLPKAIQTDAAVNPGNSGGPLLDASGRVIGITSQIISDSDSSAGIGFAIPINTAAELLPQLRAGHVSHGFLGISGRNRRGPDGANRGARVVEVRPGSAAARAGLEVDDVITAVDGVRVRSIEGLQIQISGHAAGDVVELTVQRDGSPLVLEARLQDKPGNPHAG